MKKLLSILLALVMVFSLAACSGGQGSTDENKTSNPPASDSGNTAGQGSDEVELKPYKIAVAFTQINATALAQQEYLEKYIGPAFNVEFMFSEAVDSAEVAMTFIENAYAAGCQAIMNFQNSSVEQINAKANELGMYIISNSPPAENNDLPYVLGNMRIPVSGVAESFKEVVNQFTSDGKDHNVVIISAGAGLGNTQHYECTYAILEALQQKYGLTYSDTIENLASSRGMTEVDTGTDMRILLYPGYPNADTYVSGLSAELQTGVYDVVLGCNFATTKFAVAIDEVERAYNVDVKVGYVTSIDDAATAAVTTKDVHGNSSVDSIIINPGDTLVGGMFAVLYNGLSGHADAMRTDGAGTVFDTPLWLATDAETYLKLAGLNGSADTLEMSVEDIQEMLCIYNADVTASSLQEKILTLTADGVLSARGLK
ncbi:MAG: hypothetical protein ACI3XJ_07120 [Oscillospiraceae bacterium]